MQNVSAKTMPIALGILAGGLGTRLGGVDKGELRLPNGVSLTENLCQLWQGLYPNVPILISKNYCFNFNNIRYKNNTIFYSKDRFENLGPLSGIVQLLENLPENCDYLLTMPVDCAVFPKDFWVNMIAFYEINIINHKQNKPVFLVIKNNECFEKQPLCAIWSREQLPFLQKKLQQNQLSVWRALAEINAENYVLEKKPEHIWSINTPEEWAKLQCN